MSAAALAVGFAAALAGAPGDVDQAAAREFSAAVRLRKIGRAREAAEAFVEIAERHPVSREAPRALASAGELYRWQLGDVARAIRLYDRVLASWDAAPGVVPALRERLSIERERGGPKAELELAHALFARRPEAEQAPWLLVRAARILADDLGRKEDALAPLARVEASFPGSARVDEAQMDKARILRALGRPRDALREYQKVIATKRTSWIVGDYNSALLDDAYFLRAETLEREVRDPRPEAEVRAVHVELAVLEAAEKAYVELPDELPHSLLADDALERARRIAERRGDLERARALARRLEKALPESRYVRKARR